MSKQILDATCGSRSIWFDKHNPLAVFMDAHPRLVQKEWTSNAATGRSTRTIECAPDIVADFTDTPFPDNTFALVVFDPPHLRRVGETSWYRAKYGQLDEEWETTIRDGFRECMRVLRPWGILVFKWAETEIPIRRLLKAIGTQPLFGHRSGKRSGTHWMCFIKEGNAND